MTQLFHFFDNSKPGYGLHQVYWIDGATVSGTLDAVNGSNAWRQNSEVLIPPQEYFVDMWREACRLIADRLPAGQLVCLDMEHIPHVKPDGTSDYSYLVTLARTFRQRMPGTRLSFLLPDLPYNRQDVRSSEIAPHRCRASCGSAARRLRDTAARRSRWDTLSDSIPMPRPG